MSSRPNITVAAALMVVCCIVSLTRAERMHFTYMWHLEQPIYWPDQQVTGQDRYERAWESILSKDGGATHPSNNLRDIFGWPDRVAAYQNRCRDSINAIRGHAEAGAQISYSGGLVENIQSLGAANQLGYSPTWYSWLREARGWTTVGQAKPRCDIVIFPFHHSLLPLIDEAAVRKEIQLYKAIYAEAWGASPGLSKGLFPPEMAFSMRLIKVLAEEGIDWVIVSGEHVSRSCSNFPVIYGTAGINCDPPNLADQVNPPQQNWYRKQIDRGCSPASALPFGNVPHRTRHVDPTTGQVYQVIVVPSEQALSWDNGYSAMGTGPFNTFDAHNNPARPMLVVLSHDGDNAWGGGYSYYMEATPNLVNAAQSEGFTATVIEEYLSDHPVPADDFVHVEDGAWVNADGDFGSPIMLNWNWPLVTASGQIDISNGWAEDERNWAVITAAQNRVLTAEQIAGGVNIGRILHPDAASTRAERAWHYFLGALNSGYMYYGTAEDMEVKPTIACNEAVEHADVVIGDASLDATPPTIWIPQRHPWNPGSTNFGPQYGYQQYQSNGDFWVWTFVHDVSSVTSVTLRYRVDADGVNSLATTHNETYAGGPEVGPWQGLPMTHRAFPAGNVYNDPNINFFEMPQYIAGQYYVQVTGLRSVLIDYYVEAVDGKGLVARSPIQHVYIGSGEGGGPGGDAVTIDPAPAQAGQPVTIRYNPTGRPLQGATQVYLHYGFNQWNPVIAPDPAMTWNAADSAWQVTVPVPLSATQFDLVFNNGVGTWDNNNGADWHFAVTGGGPPPASWQIDGQLDADATLVAANNGMHLWAGVKGDLLYVACEDAGEGNDHFIFMARTPGALRAAPWAKAGQVAGWDAYLADENDNNWQGWFDASGSVQSASGTGGGVLEGTIHLVEELGTMPAWVYLAVAPYPTANGAALLPAWQVPASINGDENVDAGEYAAFDTVRPGDCTGDWRVTLDDLPCFVNVVLGVETAPRAVEAADVDGSGQSDGRDVAAFVGLLVAP